MPLKEVKRFFVKITYGNETKTLHADACHKRGAVWQILKVLKEHNIDHIDSLTVEDNFYPTAKTKREIFLKRRQRKYIKPQGSNADVLLDLVKKHKKKPTHSL